ncbi:MAG: response regulator, partial [Candidatus Angelobacter sp.]
LDERADYLRRVSDIKTSFFSNVSHEFRTPLNSIMSLSRMLLERIDGELTPEQEKQVRYISQASRTLADMVNDLLDLARVESGKVRMKVKTVDVEELFSALKGMLKPLLADNRSVELVFEDGSGLPPLRTDEGKISQILRNFISNAIKFTPQGEVKVSAMMSGAGMVVFQVRDTGIGIAPEHHESIFQEFTQIENPLQERYRGTGLGLPLCRNLATLLGGRVWLESEFGRGSTFFVEIPAVYRGQAETEGEIPALEFNRLPVLLIDDNPEAFAALEPHFRNSEFQLVYADTLERATRWLVRQRPGAIIANIYLNGSSIGNFFKVYKDSRKGEGTVPPIIGVSVYDESSQALLSGADVFFKKPFDATLLLRELRRLTLREQPKRLLVVDDNEISLYILRQLLDRPWLLVLEARNGKEALEMVAREHPDAIILDLVMPDMSGMEILETLRTEEKTRRMPVIIYTSKNLNPQERQRIEELGASIMQKNDVATTLEPGIILESLARIGILEGQRM